VYGAVPCYIDMLTKTYTLISERSSDNAVRFIVLLSLTFNWYFCSVYYCAV